MKSRNKKQSSIHVITLLGILLTTFFIYSCNTDGYSHTDKIKTEENPIAQTRSFAPQRWNTGNVLIDSVANSDEFYEFERCSEQLADKFSSYTSNLNDQEYDKLMEKLNNEEYVEDFIKKAKLENELQQMDEAKKGLLEHTVFLRLSENEQTLLFRTWAENHELTKRKVLKTRNARNGNSKCEELKQAAYTEAETNYTNAIAECRRTAASYLYYIQVSSRYARDRRIADREYEACINNK